MAHQEKGKPDSTAKTPSMPEGNGTAESPATKKKHLIHPTWLRRTVKTIGWTILGILLLAIIVPVALYIPFVQDVVKDIACSQVEKATGMKIGIERFRLRFPLDAELDGVYVVEASGDTMVRAKKAVADVKLLPLLHLDVKLNKLMLQEGYYRMVLPDSSMIMTIDAGMLNVDGNSSANIARSEINLNKAELSDGRVSLYMDVWKKKPTPADTTSSTPFLIKANDLRLKNITFAMSMLPTIDTLRIEAGDLALQRAVIDLRTNTITARRLAAAKGKAIYVSPTPEYIATHPAPVDTISPPSPPMVIKGDSVSLSGFDVLYAIKGAQPMPGFDANYVKLSGVDIGLADFYNKESTVILPIVELRGKERSGLDIRSGSGTLRVDSTGLALDRLHVATTFSDIKATAGIPFALMNLEPTAPVNAEAEASIGLPDIEAFMPAVKEFTAKIPGRQPLKAILKAHGTLGSVNIPQLDAAMAGIFSLRAKGYADNPLDFKKLKADLDLDGSVVNPGVADKFLGNLGFRLPSFTIKGKANARGETYGADFALRTSAGDVAARGKVALNSERYDADLRIRNLNVAHFLPDMGIGSVSADITAGGAGFNPLLKHAGTDANIKILSILYNGHRLTDITADANLHDGIFSLNANSPNELLDLSIDGSGSIDNGNYTFDVTAEVRNADLQALGFTPDVCGGKGTIYLAGSANPEKWLYDAEMKVAEIEWHLPGQLLNLPHGMTARLTALPQTTELHAESALTYLNFTSAAGLKDVIDKFTAVADTVTRQIEKRELDVAAMQRRLPPFNLDLNASGRGLINEFLGLSGMAVDTVYANLSNDSIITGRAGVTGLNSGKMRVDTLNLNVKERGQLLDYRLHMGNRKGTLDEFAQVDLNGYIGSNRAALMVTQKNIRGEMGYRIGMTAAFLDQAVELHFTPLRATIAYLPWTLNADNHVEYNFNGKITANLLAKSNESSILMMTEPGADGVDELHVNLDNIHIQDFLKLSVFAPPITATIDSDLRVKYTGTELNGHGTIGITDFTYDKMRVGDFDLEAKAGMNIDGTSSAEAALKIDGKRAAALHTVLRNDSVAGMVPETLVLNLTDFPLSVANAFLGEEVATLSGGVNGNIDLTGTFTAPVFNGYIACDSVGVYIPMAGTKLKFDNEPITVTNNILAFNNFDILAVNNNPLTINGTVDATKFSDVKFDLRVAGENVQLVGVSRKARTDLYGKLFVNLNASARGPMKHFDINANATVLGTTDLTYNLMLDQSQLTEQSSDDVVRFVQFNDTTATSKADSIPPAMSMRITANATIAPGTLITVNLSQNGTDKAQLSPSGTLNFFQNYMGDMRLNGQLNTGNGFARYSLPLVGERMVTFVPTSYVLWNGDIMNPVLNLHVNNVTKATIVSGGNSRLVNFDIAIGVTNTLNSPNLNFDLSTQDDLTVENELSSMSADQRASQAMNLILYGTYTGPGTRTDKGPATSMLYSYLSSQINSWAAKNIRGVDLSFGINQYDKTTNGENSTTMSYSYQVSKSLFNNRFKIVVGGNYATDASADENLSQNLISDISFEYMIRQTQSVTMLAKLFRHNGYESILEGEITETGVGFELKRRLQSLRGLFRNPFKTRRRTPAKEHNDSTAPDTTGITVKTGPGKNAPENPDTLKTEKRQ